MQPQLKLLSNYTRNGKTFERGTVLTIETRNGSEFAAMPSGEVLFPAEISDLVRQGKAERHNPPTIQQAYTQGSLFGTTESKQPVRNAILYASEL